MANFLSKLPKYSLLGMIGDEIEEDKEEERRKKMLMGQSMGMKRGGRVKKFSKGGSMSRNDSRASGTPSRVVKDTEKAKASFDEAVSKGANPLKAGEKYNKTMAARYKVAYGDRPSRVTGMKKGGTVRGDGCCMKGKTKGRFR